MGNEKETALKEATRVLQYILKDELAEDDKNQIVKDSIENFNEHVNPGWLLYRKSVSTDATFVEWEDSEETFGDVYGTRFIDCLGGYGVYTAGHRNPEIVKAVEAQLSRYATWRRRPEEAPGGPFAVDDEAVARLLAATGEGFLPPEEATRVALATNREHFSGSRTKGHSAAFGP